MTWKTIQKHFKKLSLLKIETKDQIFSNIKTQNYEKQKSIEMKKAFMKDNSQPNIIIEQKVFIIDVKVPGDYVFTVTQKGKANMSAQDSEKYSYSDVRIFLVEVPQEMVQSENNKTKLNKGCTFIDGYLRAEKRDIYVSALLNKAGQYALIAEADWDIKTSEKVFSLTSYGPQEVQFVENFDISISEVLRSACDSVFKKYDGKKIEKQITDKDG